MQMRGWLTFGHGGDGGEFPPHAVMAECPLDDLCRVIGTCVTSVLAFQQFQLLVQQILRQLVPKFDFIQSTLIQSIVIQFNQ